MQSICTFYVVQSLEFLDFFKKIVKMLIRIKNWIFCAIHEKQTIIILPLKDIKQVMKFKDLQFEKCVPKCLMNQWNCANLEAFCLQKKEMRTLTIIKNNEVQL